MRIRRTVIALSVAMLAVPVLAGVAFAGGRPDPPPPWLGDVIVVGLTVIGALFVLVIAAGLLQRRYHRR